MNELSQITIFKKNPRKKIPGTGIYFCWKNSCTTCIIHVIFEASIELPELMDTGRQTYLRNFVGFLNAGGTIINPTETIRLLQRDHLVEDCIEDLLNNQYPVCLQ